MAFSERLRVIIDTVTDGATKGLAGFRTSITQADGATGKLKAGWASASDSIRANAAQIAVVGGAALVAFGVKALAAFENTAKAALDMSKVTGQTVENASRWIAVGDDYRVGAEAITTAMIKVGKTGADFIDTLEKINNAAPADRARVAFELLGKSAKGIAPLLGHTRAEYEKMLGAVEKGQVITDKEAAKAERMRLAQDALSDALKEVTLAAGEFVAELAPMIEGLSDAVTWMANLNEEYGEYIALAKDMTNPFEALNIQEDLLEIEGQLRSTIKEGAILAQGLTQEVSPAVVEFGDDSLVAAQRAGELSQAEDDLTTASDNAAMAIRDADAAADQFLNTLSKEEELLAFSKAMDELAEKARNNIALTDAERLAYERMFLEVSGTNAVAAKEYKVLVDSGQLDAALLKMEQIKAFAAAGVTLDVNAHMIVGSELRALLEGGSGMTTKQWLALQAEATKGTR